ncbi:lysylphosphatidylglycerol synthase transmembrane domain-containing protein [Occultella gossypii]|uniref:Flippase-like domain-containing protein n=1 Tax=Occultella gossypii TaxID=2800820 RepID=A0ABS7S2T8_9MICO|nr:lysylphosphatidylglycerol synthase transmembrane domain-containing protein [Occultella gossypii]MBZ2194656.1 flippase-like domain-containing protein [Occultella gossypii]
MATEHRAAVNDPHAEPLPDAGAGIAGPKEANRSGRAGRWFAGAPRAPRDRRPSDAVLLGVSVLILLLVLAFARPASTDVRLLESLGEAGWFGSWVWQALLTVLMMWAALLITVAIARGRWHVVRDQVGAAIAAALGAVVVGLTVGSAADVTDALVPWAGDGATYPGLVLAVTTAVVTVTAPQVVAPVRRIGRALVVAGAIAAVATGITGPWGSLTGVAIGWVAAAVVHLIAGSPGGRLTLAQVGQALREIGVDAHDLRYLAMNERGQLLVAGVSADGTALLVRVYGRDAWDSQFMTAVGTSLWYRDREPSARVSRLGQVQHEAFATLLAERSGVPVLPIVAAGLAGDRDALLAIRADARPYTFPGDGTDGDADALAAHYWAAVARLHKIGLSHGSLRPSALMVRSDGSAALADLSQARISPTPFLRAADNAGLLIATAMVLGPERAVAAASAALSGEQFGEVLPLVQPGLLDRTTRKQVRDQGLDLGALRTMAGQAAGVEPPKLAQLRRLSLGKVLTVVVVVLLAYVIVGAISGIGLDNLIAELSAATPGWVIAAILVTPLVQVGSAMSTIGASPRPLRFLPVLALQYAIQFMGLVVPSVAARVALIVRFFQRAGLPSTTAVTVGAIDGASGIVTQAIMLVVLAATGLVSLTLPSGGVEIDIPLALIALGLVAAIAIAWAIPPVRRFLPARLAETHEGLQVLRSPKNLALMLVGNVIAQTFLAVVLSLSLRAFGQELPLTELILIQCVVALFAGLMPVPGGIGVAEAALTGALVAAGVEEATALSTAIVFRLATFYLPPAYGGPALGWLRRRGDV